jgi:hypothetical protein
MPVSTIMVLVSVVVLFATFASALAWAQLHLQMHDPAIARKPQGLAGGDRCSSISQRRVADLERQTHGRHYSPCGDDLVAAEPFKCASPGAAIERAMGYWKTLGHAGAVAFVRTGYPVARTSLLRAFGHVPDGLPLS